MAVISWVMASWCLKLKLPFSFYVLLFCIRTENWQTTYQLHDTRKKAFLHCPYCCSRKFLPLDPFYPISKLKVYALEWFHHMHEKWYLPPKLTLYEWQIAFKPSSDIHSNVSVDWQPQTKNCKIRYDGGHFDYALSPAWYKPDINQVQTWWDSVSTTWAEIKVMKK